MKLLKQLLFVSAWCIVTHGAFAQQSIVTFAFCAVEPGLGCGCEAGTRVPFADGANSWCIFWDRNVNGPDGNDSLVPVGLEAGQSSYSCQTFNGEAYCGTPGNFYADPAWTMQDPPPAPDQPVYYIKISGPNCCWVTDTMRILPGQQDINLTEADFNCTNSPCAIGAAPDPVTNVTVSDDQFCNSVQVSWDHDGENVSGFSLFLWNSETSEWEYELQVTEELRTRNIEVCVDGEVRVGVASLNGSQQADIVQGVGRTFLRHFNPGNEFDIDEAAGEITMFLTSPPQGDLCTARLYFDFYSGGNFVQRMCEVTDPDQLTLMEVTCDLPGQVPNPSCYIVMRDSSTADILLGCGLTDTIFFALDGEETPELPREFALKQNYPNPFNPSTMIEYAVPFEGDVELSVFNLVGQKVATLVNGKVGAGQHVVEWNAQGAATGMYFYRLQMGSEVMTRKMLLLK